MLKSKLIFTSAAVLMGAVLIGIGVIAQGEAPAVNPEGGEVVTEAVPVTEAAPVIEAPTIEVVPVPAAELPAAVETPVIVEAPALVETPAAEIPAAAPTAEVPATDAPAIAAPSLVPAAADVPAEDRSGVQIVSGGTGEVAVVEAIVDTNATAQIEQPVGTNEVAAVKDQIGDIPSASVVTNAEDNLITLKLDDTEMAQVIEMFVRISGANIIANPSNLHGRVTVILNDVNWQPALESILSIHNLALIEKPKGTGVYVVETRAAGQADPMKVETIFLKFANVSNVMAVLKPMMPGGSTLQAFPSRSAIVAKSTSDSLGEIKQVIEKLDKVREQVFIESKFLELNDGAQEDLGINWKSLAGWELTAGNLSASTDQETIWKDNRKDSLVATEDISTTDSLTRGYNVNTADEYTDSEAGSYGDSQSTTLSKTTQIGDPIDTSYFNYADTVTEARSAILGAAEFTAVLSALKQAGGTKVVSNPKIVVANEEEAIIHVGQTERAFIATVTPASDNAAAFTTYNPSEPIETGVKVIVTPTINTDSNITVRIVPEISRLTDYSEAPDGKTKYPIISTKKVTTVFSLESGKTVAIGGLTEGMTSDSSSKIPLLGDIPIIGKYLFSWSHKENEQNETIIFVTLSLAKPSTIGGGDGMEGLPEDTDLAREHMILDKVHKNERAKELQKMREAAESADSEEEQAKVKERLLRRTK